MRRVPILLAVLGALVLLVTALVSLRGPEPAGVVPRGTPATPAPPVPTGADPVAWAGERSAATGIPVPALQAYAAAELAQREATPACGISWATLAGVGRIESNHGRFGGSTLVDGVARPPIVGIRLDGTNGTRVIADTDGGRLDGDRTHDRAVGPMQFLPQTWARYGQGDPQSMEAAARAAAAYLCSADRVLADGHGWWDGVLTYNRSVDYARDVWAAADRYATAA